MEKVVSGTFLVNVFHRVQLVYTRTAVARIAAEGNVQGLKEAVHTRNHILWSVNKYG